ncbi:MAG: response regulator [Candidatus Micrarchaeia archaeon]|jgi:DNA-binding response OmpR family regulator
MAGKKIMVVDDEKDIRDTVKDLLLDNDFEVETAENGKDLLKKLQKTKPDLIILDILMPGLTTYEILSKIKEKKIKTPIIFLTVVRFAEQTRNIITDNMIDYIEKPFDNKDLIKRVKNALM